jgi:hypothetical protein
VAQRNLDIRIVSPKMQLFLLPFLAGGQSRKESSTVVTRRIPVSEMDSGILRSVGIGEVAESDGDFRISIGRLRPGVDPSPYETTDAVVEGEWPQQMAVAVELNGQLEDGHAVAFTAEELGQKGTVLGGVSALIVSSEGAEVEKQDG